jgi:hypothetical protein
VIVRGIRCAAHTLQLAVEDALTCCPDINLIIGKARDVAKHLRTPNVMYILRAQKAPCPILDTETRWMSKFDMLERLLELKNFCQSLQSNDSKLLLSDCEWDSISAAVEILRPAKVTTLQLQSDQLTAGVQTF